MIHLHKTFEVGEVIINMAGHRVSMTRQKYHDSKNPKAVFPTSSEAEIAKDSFKVLIHEGEINRIKEWTLMKDNIETGGDLFGLWIDKHTAVVQFVLGPGQGCRRTNVSFHQDTTYLEKAGKYLTQHHGLCNIGQWHSHHRLNLSKPSAGDENTVWGNMPGLGMERYIVFIANIMNNKKANVNCFLFEIDNQGRRFSVLKGTFHEQHDESPFRQNESVLKDVLPGQEDLEKMKRTANTQNKFKGTVDIDSESNRRRTTEPAKDHGMKRTTPSHNGLSNDEVKKSKSSSKISPQNKREQEDKNSQKGERVEMCESVRVWSFHTTTPEKVSTKQIKDANERTQLAKTPRADGGFEFSTDNARDKVSATPAIETREITKLQGRKRPDGCLEPLTDNPRDRKSATQVTYVEEGTQFPTDNVKEHRISAPAVANNKSVGESMSETKSKQMNKTCDRPDSFYDNVKSKSNEAIPMDKHVVTSKSSTAEVTTQPKSASNIQEKTSHDEESKVKTKTCCHCLRVLWRN